MGEPPGEEFWTLNFAEEEDSEFDYADARAESKGERKRDRRDDRVDPPHSPRVRWNCYYYDGASDGRRGRSGLDRGFHAFLEYPDHCPKEASAARESACLTRWQPNARLLPPLAMIYS